MNPTATLSWLGSSHAKCSYITFHKKSDFCQLLRTPSPKCVKLLRRFKGQKDLIFFPSLEMSHQTEFLNIHSFQKERHLRCLGGLGNLTSWHLPALKHLWICVACCCPNNISHTASTSLPANLTHPDGAVQTLVPAEQRAVGQQERPLLLEMWVAQHRGVNP